MLPYLARPYEYVSPYVKKADDIGNKTLCRLESTFPVVQKPTAEVVEDTKSIVLFPYRKASEGRDHVLHVYADERKQIAGDGVVPASKALVSTALVVVAETLGLLRSFFGTTKQQASEKTGGGSN